MAAPAIFRNMTKSQSSTPNLRDIFTWLPHTRNVQQNPWARGQVSHEQNPQGTDDWEFFREGGGESGIFNEGWRVRSGSRLDQLNQQYGLNARVINENNQYRSEFNTDRLPTTRFGSVSNVIPVDEQTRLINPNLVYDDPVYGRITHRSNMARPNAWLGPALMAIVGAGMGSVIGGAGGSAAANTFRTANTLMRGAGSLFEGGNPTSFLLNMALGQVPGLNNLSPALRPVLNMAISQMLNQRGRS